MKSVDNKEILPGFSFNMSAMGMGIHNWVGTCLIHQNFMSQSLSILLLMLAYFFTVVHCKTMMSNSLLSNQACPLPRINIFAMQAG